jgi:anti-sigma B factor antagonist
MPADSDFEVRLDRLAEAIVVTVAGEIDLASSEELRAALRAPEAQAATVVLDLRAVTFIDSSGLSVIVAEHQRAQAVEHRLVVAVDGASMVERLFELTGLRKTLILVPDPAAALTP